MIREGFDAIFQVDPNMVVKKKKEDEDEVTEVQEGWKGHILPFELVQEEFHHGELFAIQSGEERLVEISNMYTEILESLEEDELEQTITNDDKNAFVGKEVKAYVTEALTDVESPEINALKNYLTLSFKKDKMAFIEENPFVAWSAMVSNKDGTIGKPAVNSRILQLQMEFEFPEESLEAKMKRVMLLMEEESELKKVIKAQKIELEAATIETIKNIDTQFFAYMFKKKEIIHLFEINSQGLTSDTWNLKYPAFSKIVVRVPRNVEEQSRIARFLLELDELISCTEQEIEITKRMKKGCLQKMFVCIERTDDGKIRLTEFAKAHEEECFLQFIVDEKDGTLHYVKLPKSKADEAFNYNDSITEDLLSQYGLVNEMSREMLNAIDGEEFGPALDILMDKHICNYSARLLRSITGLDNRTISNMKKGENLTKSNVISACLGIHIPFRVSDHMLGLADLTLKMDSKSKVSDDNEVYDMILHLKWATDYGDIYDELKEQSKEHLLHQPPL